jgi:hypothetical protein
MVDKLMMLEMYVDPGQKHRQGLLGDTGVVDEHAKLVPDTGRSGLTAQLDNVDGSVLGARVEVERKKHL